MTKNFNVVNFAKSQEENKQVIDLLSRALDDARKGVLYDVAVIGARRDENGPQFWFSYYAEEAYATIIAGISALEFDLHYRRYVEEE